MRAIIDVKRSLRRLSVLTLVCMLLALNPYILDAHSSLPYNQAQPAAASASELNSPAPGERQQVADTLLKMPLLFIANQGQVDSQAAYYAKMPGQTVYLTPSGMIFDLVRYQDIERANAASEKAERLTFSLKFLNANTSPLIEGGGKDRAMVNYLIGNDPQKWHTDISTYREVTYKDIYPGIDFRLYGKEGGLEYEFVVQPGANVSDIALAYAGVEGLNMKSGQLVIGTSFGEIMQNRPYIYQQIDSDKVEVEGGFSLLATNAYGFQVAYYDASYPLVIDPSLSLAYSTCLGGNNVDVGRGIAVESGCAYVTGSTDSINFPILNQYQADQGGTDAFVCKIDTTRSGAASLIYSTYLGGGGVDTGYSIGVESGCAYITGFTDSTDFPTLNQYQSDNTSRDAFVTRLNAAGNGLVYSTYLGGNANDTGYGIAVEAGCAYVTGYTSSTDFPILNQYQYRQSNETGFVAKLDTAQSGAASLIYSTYLGGSNSGTDFGRGIAVESGCAYVTGSAGSADFPILNQYQTHQTGVDAFVTKLNTAGNGLIYSTYLGGDGEDIGHGIAVESGYAYVTGSTRSTDFPTLNQYQTDQGQIDAFVSKVDTTKSGTASLIYSTYLGGSGGEWGNGIAVESGCAYVTGWTVSADFPTLNQYQTYQTSRDAFVTKVDTLQSGSASLIYSTYLGGSVGEYGNGIAVESGCAYVTGETNSADFPTLNQYQSYQFNTDAFVTKFGSFGSTPPTVITENATGIVITCATLNGRVDYDRGEPCQYRFCRGTSTGVYTDNTTWSSDNKTTGQSFNAYICSLASGTRYYYIAQCKNSTGTGSGAEKTFTTLAGVPTVTTDNATGIGMTSATLNGTLIDDGGGPCMWRFVWDKDNGEPYTYSSPWQTENKTTGQSFTMAFDSFDKATKYYYRSECRNSVGTGMGMEKTFTTLASVSTVATDNATGISNTFATLSGILTNDGGEPCRYRFCRGTVSGVYTDNTTWSTDNRTTGQSFSDNVTTLLKGKTYYYVAECSNSGGTGRGLEKSFTTTNIGVFGFVGIGIDPPQRILHVTGTGPGTVPWFQRGTDSAGFIIERTPTDRWVLGVNEEPSLGNGFVLSTYPVGAPWSTPRLFISPSGAVTIPGSLTKGGGSFKIDHPLDPENKYLQHSFVESPDMLNVYTSNVVLDNKGEAVVELPAYFQALNRDFSYQLDCVGGFAPLYVSKEIVGNSFSIAGGKPGMRVSWQVTGIRQDAFANAHPIVVEQEKPAGEKGFYMHPIEWGHLLTRGIRQ